MSMGSSKRDWVETNHPDSQQPEDGRHPLRHSSGWTTLNPVALWQMSESVNKRAIGRTWLRRIQSRGSITHLPGLIREGFLEELEAMLP